MEHWLTHIGTTTWPERALQLAGKILLALLVLWVGVRLCKWMTRLTTNGLRRADIEPTAVTFLGRIIYVGLLVMLVMAVLQAVFNVEVTAFMAILGTAGLAIGLALKDSLSNVASGVMLVALKPFRVGDAVTVAGNTGTVEAVSVFQTCLRGADNQTIIIPNSLITSAAITNLTPDTRRRLELVISIGYGDSIDDAKALVAGLFGDPRILKEPAPDVLVYELADNGVKLGVLVHVANNDWAGVKFDLTERIKKTFDAHGISIPYPQHDVHIYHHLNNGNQAGTGVRRA